jgi:hypothetical protein
MYKHIETGTGAKALFDKEEDSRIVQMFSEYGTIRSFVRDLTADSFQVASVVLLPIDKSCGDIRSKAWNRAAYFVQSMYGTDIPTDLLTARLAIELIDGPCWTDFAYRAKYPLTGVTCDAHIHVYIM